MALPTSGPLSMQDIATEFSQGSTNMSLFTFGSTLPTPTVTSNIELANDFYGQSASSCTSFSWSGVAREEAEEACEDRLSISPAYHNGSGTYPVANDTVYTNSSCTTTAGTGAYKMGSGNVVVIGESGVVSEIFTEC